METYKEKKIVYKKSGDQSRFFTNRSILRNELIVKSFTFAAYL